MAASDTLVKGRSLDAEGVEAKLPDSKEILAGIPDEHGVLRDGGFFMVCDRLLADIDRERVNQGIEKYSHNHRVIFVCELFRVAARYYHYPPRKDGTSVFYSHLVGSLKYLIQDTGLTGISSLVGMMNHDTVEDFTDKDLIGAERKSKEEEILATLVDTNLYQHLLTGFDEAEAENIIKRVKQMVIGVTKWRKGKDDGATKEATFQRFLEVIVENVRTAYLKFSDRRHNNTTIAGHGIDQEGMQKQDAIIRETVDVYLPLARALGLRIMIRRMLLDCVKFQNPKLLADFQNFIRARLEQRLGPYQNKIFSHFVDKLDDFSKAKFVPPIDCVHINPRDIDHYTAHVNGSFENVRLEDLPIGRLDPMFEIVVTTNDSREAMMQVVTMILAKFGSGKGAKIKVSVPDDDDDALASNGIQITVFNKEFGGQLHFRVNEKYAEARLKRGVLAGYQDVTPENLRVIVKAALDRAVSSDVNNPASVVGSAQEELLQPRFFVLTKDGDHMEFPRGATVLDFAARVHSRVLLNIGAAYVSDDVLSPEPGRKVDLFERLEPGKVYSVDPIPEGMPKRVHLRWLLFAQSTGRKVIREYLKKPDLAADSRGDNATLDFLRESLIGSNAHAYAKHLANLFGVTYPYLMRAVESRHANKGVSRDEVIRRIGIGQIDPVNAFAELCKERFDASGADIDAIQDNLWKVEFLLPARTGELKRFSSQFTAAAGVDIYKILKHQRDYRPGHDLLRLEIDVLKSGISFYDLFKLLVRLNEYYPIRIVENPYKENRSEKELKFAESFAD